MADFRTVSVAALRWFPQSRTVVPVTPVRVQVPPSPCAVTLLPGRFGVELTLAGHAAHPAFVAFLRDVEQHAQANARPAADSLEWHSFVDADSPVPAVRLAAFEDARFFDADGLPHASPTAITACSCLLELTGAWTTGAKWGLRWKVLEVKEVPGGVHVPCLLD